MEFIAHPKIPRLSREVIITEKIDGTNGQILIADSTRLDALDGAVCIVEQEHCHTGIFAGSRKRWLSIDDDNFGFARWVQNNATELLGLGPGRHFGEWWGQGIQRSYGLKTRRFSLFDIKRWVLNYDKNVPPACCYTVPIIKNELFVTDLIEESLRFLIQNGSLAAPGYMNPEGVVVYHVPGNVRFKKTIKNDDAGKGPENESL